MNKKLVLVFVVLIVLASAVSASDFRNLYGIMWVGTACDNLRYAQSMNYDYVGYQVGMERCSNDLKRDLKFYLEKPEFFLNDEKYAWSIDTTKVYTQEQINRFNNWFVWKGNSDPTWSFPDNLATGWWFSNTVFRANPDFQQQIIIDSTVDYTLKKINNLENESIGWVFGGYAWDVPDLTGDWWSYRQTAGGVTIDLSYWNDGIESGKLHDGISHEYYTYSEATATLYKKLFTETKKTHPDMKIYYQPYNVYSFIKTMQNRSDKLELMPANEVFLCQESADSPTDDVRFLTDQRIYDSGLITKGYVCNDNPDNHDIDRSLILAGATAQNGAWMGFFGRFGGTNEAIAYQTIRDVPARLKLIRILPNWENLNHVSHEDRVWNKDLMFYQSPKSYADIGVITTTNPVNQRIYAVVLEEGYGVKTFGETLEKVYLTNEFFEPTTETTDYSIIEGEVYLATGAYILETTQTNDPVPLIQEEIINTPQNLPIPQNTEQNHVFNNTNDLKDSLVDTFIKIIVSTGDFWKKTTPEP
jgi:hypothetical protein